MYGSCWRRIQEYLDLLFPCHRSDAEIKELEEYHSWTKIMALAWLFEFARDLLESSQEHVTVHDAWKRIRGPAGGSQ
jgi:hypothetical protein